MRRPMSYKLWYLAYSTSLLHLNVSSHTCHISSEPRPQIGNDRQQPTAVSGQILDYHQSRQGIEPGHAVRHARTAVRMSRPMLRGVDDSFVGLHGVFAVDRPHCGRYKLTQSRRWWRGYEVLPSHDGTQQ